MSSRARTHPTFCRRPRFFQYSIWFSLFRTHYVEYLCGLIYRHGIDPVPALDLDELKQLFQRANSFEPNQRPGEPDVAYRLRLAETAMKEIPLDAA